MSTERALPKKRNPLLASDKTPDHSELVARRRLGQTFLSVKPGQVGTSNATRPENLGNIAYVHLRAPLPDNLKGSEIFSVNSKQPHREGYFLMRRSSDGFISATGMFKACFPWAKQAEEQAEREYIRSLDATGENEVAGSVWIPEKLALELADEYGMRQWILALLDPAPVQLDASKDPKKDSIASPPRYTFSDQDKTLLPPPTPGRGRGRPRGTSPSKSATPAKAGSPKKARAPKAMKEAGLAAARQAGEALQATLDGVAAAVPSSSPQAEEKVTVEVETTVEVNGDTETTHTNVRVAMPAHSAELALPESSEEMIARAKEMVAEARKLDGAVVSSSKRKMADLDLDDDDDDVDGETEVPAKKARLLEQEVRRQKVRNRALFGVAATLAIGAVIPYVLG